LLSFCPVILGVPKLHRIEKPLVTALEIDMFYTDGHSLNAFTTSRGRLCC
jgi:hypothetical protein